MVDTTYTEPELEALTEAGCLLCDLATRVDEILTGARAGQTVTPEAVDDALRDISAAYWRSWGQDRPTGRPPIDGRPKVLGEAQVDASFISRSDKTRDSRPKPGGSS